MLNKLDRLLLLLFSIAALAASLTLLVAALGLISFEAVGSFVYSVYYDMRTAIIFIACTIVAAAISIRFVYLSLRGSRNSVASIDQRTEMGDIRISLDTVESLALQAAERCRGVKDLKTRISASPAGLEVAIRTIVDGDSPLPTLTEEIQSNVKGHIEEITGIPVASVSVFVANIQPAAATVYKSRVE